MRKQKEFKMIINETASKNHSTITATSFFTEVLAIEGLPSELADYARNRLEKMEETAKIRKKAKTTYTPAEAERHVLREKIYAFMVENQTAESVFTSTEIAKAFEISVQKASAILVSLSEHDFLSSMVVSIPCKGQRKAYRVKDINITLPDGETYFNMTMAEGENRESNNYDNSNDN
jgi:hypothetical protein